VIPSGPLHLSSMLAHFFRAEELSGANAYLCSQCNAKRTAYKQLRVLSPAPKHLLLCLKRNTYAFSNGALVRNKIMKEVKFPCVLKLPVQQQQEQQENGVPPAADANGADASVSSSSSASSSGRESYHTYVLYACIVHSGSSAQHGHYYAIARQSDEDALAQLAQLAKAEGEEAFDLAAEARADGAQVSERLERAAQQGRWFQFNDSSVTPSSFDALQQLTEAIPSDVAYLLFYRSLEPLLSGSTSAGAADTVVEASVVRMVQHDNHAYLTELQQQAQAQSQLTALMQQQAKSAASKFNQDDLPPADSDMT